VTIRRYVVPVIGCLAVAFAAPGASRPATAAYACPSAADTAYIASPQAQAWSILCLINQVRARRGLSRLRGSDALAHAAIRHARDMVDRKYFGHGRYLRARVRAAGYPRGARNWDAKEALAWAWGRQSSPARVVQSWLASRPHRRVLLARGYRDAGVAVVRGAPFFDHISATTYAAELGFRR
jgi:uncharacterized protein YkwD